MKNLAQIAQEETLAVLTIVTAILTLAKAHKKKFLIFLVIEGYIHSMALNHFDEIKRFIDLVPFLGGR